MTEIDEVSASFARLDRDAFASAFYDRLLKANGEIKWMFAATDWKRQHALFLHGVESLIALAKGDASAKLEMERLAKHHNRHRLAIQPRLYDPWIDCLIDALSALDTHFTPTLGEAWRRTVKDGIDMMRAAY